MEPPLTVSIYTIPQPHGVAVCRQCWCLEQESALKCCRDIRVELFRLFSDISENTAVNIKDVTVNGIRSLGSEEHSRSAQL